VGRIQSRPCARIPGRTRARRDTTAYFSSLPMVVLISISPLLPLQSQGDGERQSRRVWVAPSPTLRMREREKRIVTLPLSEHLPLLAADTNTRREMNALRRVNAEEMAAYHACALGTCVRRSLAVAAFVDRRSGNATEIVFENHRRVIATFSEPGKLDDTRQTEVQGAYFPFLFDLRFNRPSWGGR
jgi:hypothetical protein